MKWFQAQRAMDLDWGTFGSEFVNYEFAIFTRRARHKKHLVVLERGNKKKCPRRH